LVGLESAGIKKKANICRNEKMYDDVICAK
jgi:hypothetical protein